VDRAPFLHEDDAGAGRLDFAQEMRIQEDGRAAVAQFADHVPHKQAPEWVEPRGRLVQEHEFRFAEEGLREPEALHHALRVRADRPARCVQQIDAREEYVRARPPVGGAKPQKPRVQMKQLEPGQPLLEPEVLGQESDPRPGAPIAERRAEHPCRSRRRRHETEQHLDRGRLPRSVRAEKAEDLPPVHNQGEVLHGGLLAEALPEHACLDDGFGHDR
jgi:hypothetical protein